jgi:hypothetical protein
MKTVMVVAAIALLGVAPALAQDYKFTVTNMLPEEESSLIAPIIVLDSALAEPFMFADGYLSEDFINTILDGDPRPMNGKIGAGVAGPILGQSGPAGVQIAGGETAEADLFVESNTLRFYAKGSYGDGSDQVISGVWDIAMGGGTLMLNRYDIGHSEGSNEITLVDEGVVKIVITAN